MIETSLNQIIGVIDGRRLNSPLHFEDEKLFSISVDSRTVFDPKTALFFAVVGDRHDGHAFIDDLYQKGVRAFVISDVNIDTSNYDDAAFIQVGDTLSALQSMAAWLRKQFNYPVLAITGSNGKTIVKEWLFDIIQIKRIVRSPKSFNSQVGVPLSVLNMNADFDMAMFEAGISMPNEMQRLAEVLYPTFGIFTNIGDAHQENFENLEQKIDEKLLLFESCKSLIFCEDDLMVKSRILRKFEKASIELLPWSITNKKADLYFSLNKTANKTIFSFYYEGKVNELWIPFVDDASIENAAHCLAFLISQNLVDDQAVAAFAQLQAIAMRMELKDGINNCSLINDYYNSDINSLEIAIQFLNQQTTSSGRKKTIILSDIKQTGLSSKKLSREVSKLLKQNRIDRFIGIGPEFMKYPYLFKNASFYSDTKSFLSDFDQSDFSNESILIKGARTFHFERISSVLQKKYHQTILEVRLHEMVENLNSYRALLKPETKIMVMVKAFSYGSGTVEIARMLQFQKVDYLAVAVADEGLELRQAGIETPIVVMNPEAHSFETMIEFRLEPNIYSKQLLDEFTHAADKMAVRNYPIHLKIDSGMHRLGFSDRSEFDEVIHSIKSSQSLRLKTAFSHLAASDEAIHDDFTVEQFNRFKKMTDIVEMDLDYSVDFHLLNSAGIERFPQFQENMVRLGIGLYGVSLGAAVQSRPVAHWLTTVSQVQNVKLGETVGYSRKGIVDTVREVAVVPVGYADGYRRTFGNGNAKVWLCDQEREVSTIGNICMDMTMIDVTGLNVKAGDSVELMGSHIQLTKLANWAETIPYEILTGISQRVKRVYVQE